MGGGLLLDERINRARGTYSSIISAAGWGEGQKGDKAVAPPNIDVLSNYIHVHY